MCFTASNRCAGVDCHGVALRGIAERGHVLVQQIAYTSYDPID